MTNHTCIRVYADEEQIKRCRKELEKAEAKVKQLAKIFNLAGNATRMRILYLLFEEVQLCVCDISDILNMKIPAISQHLRKLKDAGLVDNKRVAQTIFYYLEEPLKEILLTQFLTLRESSKALENV